MGVTGIGGFSFRAKDPQALAAWYADYLGVGGGEMGLWDQQAGPTVELAAYRVVQEGLVNAVRHARAQEVVIDVSSNDRRGVRLQPGDEIYLGRACVKVAMRPRATEMG